MKVRVLQENIAKALGKASRILSAKPQLPILNNILLFCDKDGFHVTASTLDITETTLVGAKTEREGGVCVPGRLLTDLVASLPSEQAILAVESNILHVSCGSVHATIPGVAASEYPPVTVPAGGKSTNMDKKTVISALSSVLFAAATDDSRPMYTGINIEKDEEGVIFVATDGYRLSLKKVHTGAGSLSGAVVPARGLGEIVKIALEDKGDDPIGIREGGDRQIVVSLGQTDLIVRLLDGEYPAYKKIIPTKYTTRTLFDKTMLLRAVKSAALFARDNTNIVKISIEGQRVSVSANTPNVGENTVDVEAKVDGEGGTIAFNSRFLLDLLNNFPEEEILLETTGSLNPGVFKPVKDETYLHIIMPVRVQS